MHKRPYEFMKTKELLFTSQFGFRPNHSPTDAIAKFSSHISINKSNKLSTLVFYLDLSKAFDTIDHSILLKKTPKFMGFEEWPWIGLGVICLIVNSMLHI